MAGTRENIKKISEEMDSKETSFPRYKGTKTSLNIVPFIVSLMFFITLISGSQGSFHVTKFGQNQSLYFDKLSNMQIIRDEWKMIIYYDMQPYWEGIKALGNYTASLKEICKTVHNKMNCDIILLQLSHSFTELEYYNQMLLSQHSKTQLMRQRRGLVNFVGNVASDLFGVLDSRFAEQYQKDIQSLRENQRHISAYWKNQTSVIEAGYNLLKQTEKTMNEQHKIINEHMISLEKALKALKSETQNLSVINEVTVGAIIGSNMLNNLKSLQNTLLDTVTDIYHGQFNPHILTPAQMQDELSNIASQLPKDVSLPIDNVQTDLAKIYKLLKVKARMLESYLIFEIKLPLIGRDTFEVFKTLPIPQARGDNMVNIVPVSEYLAINVKKDTYITLTDEVLRLCIVSDTYLCHIQKPIYRLKEHKDFCQKEQSECKTLTSQCKNTWMESNTMHYYVYFCCNQCPLRVICEDQISTHQLSGAGIVVMDNGCIIKTDAFTVIAHKQQSSVLTVKPDIYIPVIPSINHIINITVPETKPFNNTGMEAYSKELTEMDKKIQVLKDNAELPESISTHDIHHYTLIYIIIGVAALIYCAHIVKARHSARSARVRLITSECGCPNA